MINSALNCFSILTYVKKIYVCVYDSTTHCADKLPWDGCKQIQIHTDSYRIIDFLRL